MTTVYYKVKKTILIYMYILYRCMMWGHFVNNTAFTKYVKYVDINYSKENR